MSSQTPKSSKTNKRRTAFLDEDYIQADLNWFREKQAVHPAEPLAGTQGDGAGPVVTPVQPSSSSAGGFNRSMVQTDDVPMRERSRSRSPSIPLLQVMQAKQSRPHALSASKLDRPSSVSGNRGPFVRQKGKGKGPPGLKDLPEQSKQLDEQRPDSEVAESPATDSPKSPFAHNYIRLLALARGRPSPTPAQEPVTLAFELTTEELAQVERWRDRDATADDLATSMCVSLVTYSLSRSIATFANDDAESLVDIVKWGHPEAWPTDSSLYALLDACGNRGPPQSISLSPPFIQCEPDSSVDLAAQGLHPGVNTLQVFQSRDYSDRVFAIVLHHPTAAQLAELQRQRDQDRAWREMFDRLGTFSLPVPTVVAPQLPRVTPMYNRYNVRVNNL